MTRRSMLVLVAVACAIGSAAAHAADDPSGRLLEIYRRTGDARAHRLHLELTGSDRRLARLDADSARSLSASGPSPAAVLTRYDALYDAAVRERRAVLESALDLLLPVANHLPSGSILKLDSPILGGAAAALGMYAPQEFKRRIGGGVYLEEPFDPERDVLLAIHGINGSPEDYRAFIPSVDHARFQVWMAYYPTGEQIPEMARFLRQALAAQLARTPARRVFVVCHSLGGLVFRTLMAGEGFPGPLASLTFCSTPHRGVRFRPMSAVKLACRWLWRFLPAETGDLLEGSDYLNGLNALPAPATRVRTAAGKAWHTANAKLVGPLIPGTDDGLVPQDSTPLAGSLSYQVFGEDHYTILSAPAFQSAFHRWLDEDRAALDRIPPGR